MGKMLVPALAIAIFLSSFNAWAGIITNKDSNFGTPGNNVTVTTHGNLNIKGSQILALCSG
jgi:hypothetical protein